MKKEIELKFFIGPSADAVIKKVIALNWQYKGEEKQEDIYYTSKHKDFIITEECLRIRDTETFCELTWKPPTTQAMLDEKQFWKQEVDLNIAGQKETMKQLLQNLDFIEFVTVKKHRLKYDIDENTNISLDYIDTLGWFAEIETFASDDKQGVTKNYEIAKLLSINTDDIINIPYRDLVKAGKIYKRE